MLRTRLFEIAVIWNHDLKPRFASMISYPSAGCDFNLQFSKSQFGVHSIRPQDPQAFGNRTLRGTKPVSRSPEYSHICGGCRLGIASCRAPWWTQREMQWGTPWHSILLNHAGSWPNFAEVHRCVPFGAASWEYTLYYKILPNHDLKTLPSQSLWVSHIMIQDTKSKKRVPNTSRIWYSAEP